MTDFNVFDTTVETSSLMESALEPVWNASKLYNTSIKPSLSDDSKNAVDGSVLTWDKTHKYWTIGSSPATNNVVGPDYSEDNTVPRYDATTGKIIQRSNVIIDDLNNMTVPGKIVSSSIETSGDIKITSATGNFVKNGTFVPSIDDNSTTSTQNTYSSNKINELVTNLQNNLSPLSGEVTTLKATTQTNTNNITSLTTRVSKNEGDIGNNKTTIQTNTNNITSLTTRVSKNEGDIGNNNTTIQTNTNNITSLTTRVSKNEGDIENIKNDVTTLQTAGGGGDVSSITYTKNDTHANPAAGKVKTYVKNDGALYKKDENGAESAIGNVVGPSNSVTNTIALYNGISGKLLNNSQITVDGTDTSVKFSAYNLLQTGAIYPNSTDTYDIGSTAQQFKGVYCKDVIASGYIAATNNNESIGQLRVGDSSYAYIAEYGSTDSDTLYLHGTNVPGRGGINDGRIMHNLPFGQLSDRNYKTNINPFKIDNPVDKINDLKLMSFNLIGDGEEGTKDTVQLGDKPLHYGYIAQDVQDTFPEAVSVVDRYKTKENGDYIFDEHGNKVKETRYHITTSYFSFLQNEAIKELSSTIRNLQERIAILESR